MIISTKEQKLLKKPRIYQIVEYRVLLSYIQVEGVDEDDACNNYYLGKGELLDEELSLEGEVTDVEDITTEVEQD